MKKIFLMLLATVIMAMSADARTFVLVTGVSNYGDDDINLSQTTKDAKRFKEIIGTLTNDITLLTSKNVTRDNLLEKLGAICNRAQKGDRIIFFYSGHGSSGAICGYDRPISYDDITNLLSKSKASEKICFIDACRAGSVAGSTATVDNDWAKAVKGAKDQLWFVGCRSSEYSFESPMLGAGYFTQALLKGLRGKSDTNNDKKITAIELFKYIYKDVVKRSDQGQHPQLIGPSSMHDIVVMQW